MGDSHTLQTFEKIPGGLWLQMQKAAAAGLGMAITSNRGTISKDGIVVAFNYDPAAEVATFQLVSRLPFVDPSENDIDQKIRVWVETERDTFNTAAKSSTKEDAENSPEPAGASQGASTDPAPEGRFQ